MLSLSEERIRLGNVILNLEPTVAPRSFYLIAISLFVVRK